MQLKLLSDLLWMGNYLLLGAYTGAALNGIAILRELVFLQRDRPTLGGCPLVARFLRRLFLDFPSSGMGPGRAE